MPASIVLLEGGTDFVLIRDGVPTTEAFVITSGGPPGAPGSVGTGIETVVRTSGDGSPGTVDTYTITYSNAETSTFEVANGSDGATILSGTSAPAGGIGNDGDLYLDTDARLFYGPKTAGAWGTGEPFIGSDGTVFLYVQDEEPVGAGLGALWLDTDDETGFPGSVRPGGTVGQVYTKESASDYDAAWVKGSRDRRYSLGPNEVSVDEHDDDSLHGDWVRVDGTNAPSGNVTWVEGADSVSAINTGSDTGNATHALMRPFSGSLDVGDGFMTHLTIMGPPTANYSLGGIALSDGVTYGSGMQVQFETYLGSANDVQSNQISTGSNWTTRVSNVAYPQSPIMPMFIRLTYRGSSQWRCDLSPNGVAWLLGQSLITSVGFTPTYVGYMTRQPGATSRSVMSFEFLRRVTGVS